MLPVDMAQELILSEQELANLTKGGVVRRETEVRNGRKLIVYPRSATTRAYIMHLKSPALEAQRQFILEKSDTQRIIRSHKELELARARGEMIDGTLVDREVMNVLVSIKNHMRALPSRISSLLIGKSRAEIRAIVKKYVDLALREASDFDPQRLRGANGQRKRATRRRI
jgi:hypothetical protein